MKKLLLSTALVAATSAPVVAQNTDGMFHEKAAENAIHASEFIGMPVYRSDKLDEASYEGVQDSWDDIGEINDVIMNRTGDVEAVLVDIGGFLGLGENQVAVDMDSIKFVSNGETIDNDRDFFLVLNAPRDRLENAPVYMYRHPFREASSSDSDTQEEHVQADDGTSSINQQVDADILNSTSSIGEPEETEMATGDDAAMDGAKTPAIKTGVSREGYAAATETDLTAEKLTGAWAYDASDKHIGEVSKLLLSDEGKVEAAIVDVGGFLSLGEKPVELEIDKLDILRSDEGDEVRVYVPMSEDELEAMPEYEG